MDDAPPPPLAPPPRAPAEPPRRPEGRLARLRRAPATSALLVLLALVFLGQLRDPSLVQRFAKVGPAVRGGEVWRLFTASFLHGGLVHLLVNGLALATLGPTVEALYGRALLFLVFLIGGAAGFALSTLLVPQPSLGASAGIFALLGVLLGFALRERSRLPPPVRRGMIQEILGVAAMNLALGVIVPYVDNAAHVGGFSGGLALGLLLRPGARDRRRLPEG
jgi:rhomboid protease GluP